VERNRKKCRSYDWSNVRDCLDRIRKNGRSNRINARNCVARVKKKKNVNCRRNNWNEARTWLNKFGKNDN